VEMESIYILRMYPTRLLDHIHSAADKYISLFYTNLIASP
jgi:hypothetical protein